MSRMGAKTSLAFARTARRSDHCLLPSVPLADGATQRRSALRRRCNPATIQPCDGGTLRQASLLRRATSGLAAATSPQDSLVIVHPVVNFR
jgi:hypothetical protein